MEILAFTAILIFAFYLIDKHELWRGTFKVALCLVLLFALLIGGGMLWQWSKEPSDEERRAQDAAQAAEQQRRSAVQAAISKDEEEQRQAERSAEIQQRLAVRAAEGRKAKTEAQHKAEIAKAEKEQFEYWHTVRIPADRGSEFGGITARAYCRNGELLATITVLGGNRVVVREQDQSIVLSSAFSTYTNAWNAGYAYTQHTLNEHCKAPTE